MLDKGKSFGRKACLFIASDYFIKICSENREVLEAYFLFNWPDDQLYKDISDKFQQYRLAEKAGICVPKTHKIGSVESTQLAGLTFPLE